MSRSSVGHWLSRLQIGQKINLGYTLALGVAVSGTIVSFGAGNHYRQQVAQLEEDMRNEVELLHRLQTGILQSRTHQQQLIPLAQFPQKFDEEYAHILLHEQQIKQSWTEISAVETEPDGARVHSHEIQGFIKTYQGVPEAYWRELARLVQEIHSSQLASPADIAKAQKLLLDFTNSDLALQYDRVSDDLVGLIQKSYDRVVAAEAINQKSGYVVQNIVFGSFGLSVALAILLAILTSRALARPIQALTQIAQRATEESNFDLQATVESQDEIGSLANSFNQLIYSIKQLLEEQKTANKQLAVYSQTLEQKVEDRTQELSEKNSELQELLEKLHQSQIQIVQSEKMASLGQLVAGVAHEINNPVNFIHGNLMHVQGYAHDLLNFVQLYQKHYSTPVAEIETKAEEIDLEFLQEDLPKSLNSMKVGTDRIRQIVLSLRNFSRLDESECKAIDIHEGIDSTLLILQHRLKARPERPEIEVNRDYGTLPLVECYAGQLNQVFMNIVANAIDAIEEFNAKRTYQEVQAHPNRITIRTSVVDLVWVKIAIADDGVGIPESVQKQIFNPFFTTKPVGKGTGMGMAISYQIITEKHGGKLECFSTSGEGAEFIIQIPVQPPVYDVV